MINIYLLEIIGGDYKPTCDKNIFCLVRQNEGSRIDSNHEIISFMGC